MAEGGGAAPEAGRDKDVPDPPPPMARDKFPDAPRPRSWFPIIAMIVLMALVIFPTVFFLLSLITKQKRDNSTAAKPAHKVNHKLGF
ncbi:hypothetical protein MTO96_023985 [Rhipicephalus appendiculatus]